MDSILILCGIFIVIFFLTIGVCNIFGGILNACFGGWMQRSSSELICNNTNAQHSFITTVNGRFCIVCDHVEY